MIADFLLATSQAACVRGDFLLATLQAVSVPADFLLGRRQAAGVAGDFPLANPRAAGGGADFPQASSGGRTAPTRPKAAPLHRQRLAAASLPPAAGCYLEAPQARGRQPLQPLEAKRACGGRPRRS